MLDDVFSVIRCDLGVVLIENLSLFLLFYYIKKPRAQSREYTLYLHISLEFHCRVKIPEIPYMK